MEDFRLWFFVLFCFQLLDKMATMDEETWTFKSNVDIGSKLWKLRSEFSDVTILCGGDGNEKIPAHKIILAASSKFFHETFQLTNEVKLSQMTKDDLEPILEFMYRPASRNSHPNLEICAHKRSAQKCGLRFKAIFCFVKRFRCATLL